MTTVSQLLSDDMFNETYNKSKDQYNECMQYYIQCRFKKCLESIFEYGLINSEEGRLLFIDCCYKISSFDIVGVSLHSILNDLFNVSKWEEYIIQLNTDEIKNISSMYKILKCCYKWMQWKQKDKDLITVETYSQFIETVLSKFLKDDNNSADDVYELITFYINEVTINLLNKPRSIKLYTTLCQKYPSISNTLKQRCVLGPTYEECIKNKLKPKTLPPKTQKTNINEEIHENKQMNKKKHNDIRKLEPLMDTIIENVQDNDAAADAAVPIATSTTSSDFTMRNMIYQYKQLIFHYMQVLKNSPYKKFITINLMAILLIVYWNRKYFKRISTLTGKCFYKLLSVLDQY